MQAGAEAMLVVQPASTRDIRQAAHGFDWLEIIPWGGSWIWDSDLAPEALRRLPYMFGLQEAAGLAVLPVPDAEGAPGFARARRQDTRRAHVGVEEFGAAVRIGALQHHGVGTSDVMLPLAALNRHTLVVGSPGSGKTSTVMTILVELWRRHQIPFVVIESVKAEYRALVQVPGMEELSVISLGREDLLPLRLNPLTPPAGVRCEVHQGAVMAALKLAMPLVPPLPEILTEALEMTYRKAGWDDETTTEANIRPPTLRDLMANFDIAFGSAGYRGEALNIGSAMRVRLGNLLRGSRGKILDTVESSDLSALFERPLVIEMNDVHDAEDRAVLAAFLLDRVRAQAWARGTTGKLRHVTVIEEAHRLLGKSNTRAGADMASDTSRAQSVAAFCDAIAELRSTGEGFILSSQTPAALADAAVANTGTRIVHRLETAADRDVMMNDLGASDLSRESAARLRTGEAIARWPQIEEAELIEVQPPEGVDSSRSVADEKIRARTEDERQRVRSLLPFTLCTRRICLNGCDPAQRTEGRRTAETVGAEAGVLWREHRGNATATTPILQLIVRQGHPAARSQYCAAVHLAAAGQSFIGPNPDLIRKVLTEAIAPKESHT